MIKFILLFALGINSLLVSGQSLRIATYRYADNDRIKNIQPLASYISEELGYSTVVKSYPTVHELIEAIQRNEVDIALINTFGFLLLESSDIKNEMRVVATMEVGDSAKDNYKTAFVVPAESPIFSLNNIKQFSAQTRLTLVAEGSTSGNLVPRLMLSGIGLAGAEEKFKKVAYSNTHSNALQDILQNKADLAAMGNAEYDKLLQIDTSAKNKLRRIGLSPEIPLGPLLLNKKMPARVQNRIIGLLIALHKEKPQVLESVKNGWSESRYATKYIRISLKFYNSFKNQFGSKDDLQRILNQFI